MLTDKSVPAEDHAAEVEALKARYPRWTIWFGHSTRRWWAMPPRDLDIGGFVEAETPQKLIARIETHPAGPRPARSPARSRRPAPHPSQHPAQHPSQNPRPDPRRPSNLLRLDGVTPSPVHRVPVVAWPGGPAR